MKLALSAYLGSLHAPSSTSAAQTHSARRRRVFFGCAVIGVLCLSCLSVPILGRWRAWLKQGEDIGTPFRRGAESVDRIMKALGRPVARATTAL
ncbi:hypothetical protein D3Y57_17705 [Sphingomonas paeninsulae]|uniref:Uncharacterized protein n=1 Tax=Sphingomonas paeninsulae TaxID=2319844 RepID=A0A494TPN8_SPHPE|nr:hypothetical protein D3Y57_17705 [Sphingomonas paeninsulae]